jgi:type I restriction enzyme S subunit
LKILISRNNRNEPFYLTWEQRKLGEISKYKFSGGTPKTSIEKYWKGNIPWIQSSDLIEDQLFDVKPKKHVSKLGINHSATKLVPKNSIAIITRVGVGKLAFMPFSYCTSQDFLSLSNLEIDGNFATYSIYKKIKSEINNVQGTSIKGITKEELLNKFIEITNDKFEQQKISVFFRNIDNLITLHQCKSKRSIL